jgi:hypothetical protein
MDAMNAMNANPLERLTQCRAALRAAYADATIAAYTLAGARQTRADELVEEIAAARHHVERLVCQPTDWLARR